MPFLFSLFLLLAPLPSAHADETELPVLSDNETITTTSAAVNRQPAILHEPVVDEEASAIAREEAATLGRVLESED